MGGAGPMGGGSSLGPQAGGGEKQGGFGQGFGGKQERLVSVGVNGVLKDRYLEVSEQSRRVPVGVALIVDQDHIDRVLTSFNNSKLRFLTTQVLLNRYSGSVRPNLVGSGGAAGATREEGAIPMIGPMGGGSLGPMPMGGGFSGPKGSSSLGPRPGSSGVGGYQPGENAGAATQSAGVGVSDELENNLELVIYGIVTLYERYPKRKVIETK
jgi:hypothetical protein